MCWAFLSIALEYSDAKKKKKEYSDAGELWKTTNTSFRSILPFQNAGYSGLFGSNTISLELHFHMCL